MLGKWAPGKKCINSKNINFSWSSPMSKVANGKHVAEDAKSKGAKQPLSPNVLLAAGFILLLAIAVRTFGILDAGITWDETTYVGTAMTYLTFLPKFSIFNAATWHDNNEHPQMAKFIYAIAIKIFDGLNYGLGDLPDWSGYVSALMGGFMRSRVLASGGRWNTR